MPRRKINHTPKNDVKVPEPKLHRESTLERTPIINPQPLPTGQCNNTYKITTCATDIQYLPEIVDLALRAKEENNWQIEFEQTGVAPTQYQYPSPEPLQRLAKALLEVEQLTEPDFCPPLPYGHAYRAEPEAYMGAQVTTTNNDKLLQWNNPPLLYSQQILQSSNGQIKRRKIWFYDNFQRADEILKPPYNVTGIANVVGGKLILNPTAIVQYKMQTNRYALEFDIPVQNFLGTELSLVYCSENEQIILRQLTTNQFTLLEIHGGTVTEILTANFKPGGKLRFFYDGTLNIETDTGYQQFASVVHCNKVLQIANTNPLNGGSAIEFISILIGTVDLAGTPYDIFVEEGVNLRPLIEGYMAQLTDLSDYTSSSLGGIEVYIDFVAFNSYDHRYSVPSWQTDGFTADAFKIWGDWLKTKLNSSHNVQKFDPLLAEFDYDDGTGLKHYAEIYSQYFNDIWQLKNTSYLYEGLYNDPIFMTFALQQLIPINQILSAEVNCRTGINIWLKAVAYTTKHPETIQHTTAFGITGHNRGGTDTEWGGGWGGGVSVWPDQDYTCSYTSVLSRFHLFVSPCANTVNFDVFVIMPDDPCIDTDNDPNTPCVIVPQLYPMLIWITDKRSNTTIGSYSELITGQGGHRIRGTISLQQCLPLQEEREITFNIDDQNVQQKAAYPYKLHAASFTTNDCAG